MFVKYSFKWGFIPIITGSMLFLPFIFNLIGLSSIGPIANGLFSTMQGAGIVSGSLMSITQSLAMSGWVIVIQITGGVIASIFYFYNKFFNFI